MGILGAAANMAHAACGLHAIPSAVDTAIQTGRKVADGDFRGAGSELLTGAARTAALSRGGVAGLAAGSALTGHDGKFSALA